MDDIPLCPPWWPRIIWDLHYWPPPPHGDPPNPVNYPAGIEDIVSQLTMHTMTYKMLDSERGQQMRSSLEDGIAKTVSQLSELHSRAVAPGDG
jgi:hypothetical protein